MPTRTCRRRYPLTGLLAVLLALLAAILFFAGWTLLAAIGAGAAGIMAAILVLRRTLRPAPPTATTPFTCTTDADQP